VIGMSDARLATIRSLLAKAEATQFPAEAEAFNAKAAALMTRYAIDEAMLDRDSPTGSSPNEVVIEIHRPYIAQKALLVCEVARCLGCRGVRFIPPAGSPSEEVHVVGYPVDLELVEALVTSLMVQLSGTMLRGQPEGLSSAASAAWRRSFIGGFVAEVSDRLKAQRAATIVDVTESDGPARRGESVALVLADREESVDADFARRHPFVRTSRISAGRSRAGHDSGRSAGRSADLGGRRLAGRGALSA
jgi:hypothetical protein